MSDIIKIPTGARYSTYVEIRNRSSERMDGPVELEIGDAHRSLVSMQIGQNDLRKVREIALRSLAAAWGIDLVPASSSHASSGEPCYAVGEDVVVTLRAGVVTEEVQARVVSRHKDEGWRYCVLITRGRDGSEEHPSVPEIDLRLVGNRRATPGPFPAVKG